VIHDAVRPLVRRAVVEEAMRVAFERGAAVVGRPVDHTVKRVSDGRRVAETVPRENLWLAQTPQVFRRDVVAQAYERRRHVVGRVTDDAQLVEAMGGCVEMVRGDAANVKITTIEDLRLCEALLEAGWPSEE
jgi:2-C-methyl-D-erythritol 4-phosphate cytidylyltransferase